MCLVKQLLKLPHANDWEVGKKEMDKREFHLVICNKGHCRSDRENISQDGEKGMYSKDATDIKWAGFDER